MGAQSEPTLADAYTRLLTHWRNGGQDREVGLHLMFLAWYLMMEPGHITGLDEGSTQAAGLQDTFNEVHSRFEEPFANDAEFLYVVGLMALLSPWLLGDHERWTKRSNDYRDRHRLQYPDGINPNIFDESDAYGAYFASQARVEGGY